jgi:hypothetical protein
MASWDAQQSEDFEVPCQKEDEGSLGIVIADVRPKKKVWMLEQVLERISDLQKLPPRRDATYFREVCGLHEGIGVNPHQLKEKRDVPPATVIEEWGIPRGRSGFRIGQCVDHEMRRRAQHMWRLCYGRVLTAGQLISKEFVLGIIVEYKMSMEVDWVGFAVETNGTQHVQYYTNMTKWINMRNELQKKSKVCDPRPDIIHISHSYSDSERPSDSSRSVPTPTLELSPQ